MRVAVVYNLDLEAVYGETQDYLAIQDTANTATAIFNALKSKNYPCDLISVSRSLDELDEKLTSFDPRETFIFNNCDGFQGISTGAADLVERIEKLGFSHTSASPDAIRKSTNKLVAKEYLNQAGIRTPLSRQCTDPACAINIPFPLIVKPVAEEASLGICLKSVVTNQKDLSDMIAYILETYQQPAMVEQFIEGRELVSAVLGNGAETRILPVSEMDFSQIANPLQQILTYESKWVEGTFYHDQIGVFCPAALTEDEKHAIEEISLATYQALDLRDFCRIDLRMKDGLPYVLEANDLPDLAPTSGYARAAFAAGFDYAGLIETILKIAMQREGWHGTQNNH